MRTIKQILTYRDEPLKRNVLYLSSSNSFFLSGSFSFITHGSFDIGDASLSSGTYRFDIGDECLELSLDQGALLMFLSLPSPGQSAREVVPVPDVPDMLDAQNAQMYSLFEQWAAKRGLELEPLAELPPGEIDTDDYDPADIPIDTDSLVSEEEPPEPPILDEIDVPLTEPDSADDTPPADTPDL